MDLRDALGESQAEAQPAVRPGIGGVALGEFSEYLHLLILGQADPLVRNRDFHAGRPLPLQRGGSDRYATAVRGELDRVVDELMDGCARPAGVCVQGLFTTGS